MIVKQRMGIVEGAALALGLEPLLVQYIGTANVYLVSTAKGNYRGRITPKRHTEIYHKVTHKLDYLPKCVHTKDLDDCWHVEFIEWFEGMTFKQLKPFGIPNEAFHQFGRFIKDCDDLEIGIGDCHLANIFYTFYRGVTFMCDVDMFNRKAEKYIPVCVNRVLRGATEEQENAFSKGYRQKL